MGLLGSCLVQVLMVVVIVIGLWYGEKQSDNDRVECSICGRQFPGAQDISEKATGTCWECQVAQDAEQPNIY